MSSKETRSAWVGDLIKELYAGGEGWLQNLEYLRFVRLFEETSLCFEDVKGVVLVAGTGSHMVERGLVCTSDSEYRKVRPEVKKLLTCEIDSMYSPEYMLKDRMVNGLVEGLLKGAEVGSLGDVVEHYPMSLWELLDYVPDGFLDCLMFCRVPNLPVQLGDDGLRRIWSKLSPGGMGLVTGSLEWGWCSLKQQADELRIAEGEGVKVEFGVLPNLGGLFNVSATGHGYVLQRKARTE